MRLKEISISGFRAFNKERTFQFDEKITVFIGINGTGKTSLCDAIQFGILGKLPQYKDIEEANKFQDMVINRNNPYRKVRVSLKFSNGSFITREKRSPKTILKPNREVKISESSGVPSISYEDFRSTIYLRQEQIRRFIEANQRTKVQELSTLLGVEAVIGIAEGVKQFRETLKDRIRIMQRTLEGKERYAKAVEEQRRIVLELKEEIKKKWRLNEKELSNRITVANLVSTSRKIRTAFNEICSRLKLDIALPNIKEDIASVGVFINQSKSLRKTVHEKIKGGMEAVSKYKELEGELEGLDENLISKEISAAQEKIEENKRGIESKGKYAALIAYAKDYLSEKTPNNCPICECPIDAKAVLRRLEEIEHEETEEIEKLKKEIEKLKEAIRGNEEKLARIQKIKETLSSIESQYLIKENYSEIEEKFKELCTEFEQIDGLLKLRLEKQKVDGLLDIDKIPSAEEMESDKKELQHLRSLEKLVDILNDELQTRYPDFINQRLKELDSYVEEYTKILSPHPKFPRVCIRYENGNYWLKGASENEEEVYARALFSTAQLNETAIILLLAMANSAKHRYEFIILDDPSQSLDKEGKKKLAELLVKVAESKQLVICTMDLEFGEFFRSLSPMGKFYLFEGYTDEGPVVKEWNP